MALLDAHAPEAPGRPGEPILTADEVVVAFGGLRALDGATIAVHEGEIVGLIGPNGAGKTTLMDCISGLRAHGGGRILHRGLDLAEVGPADRAALGIGRTLQNVRLFPYLSCVDNIRVALHRHQRTDPVDDLLRLPTARREERRILDRAEELIELIGMGSFAEKFASELSYGTLRLLELACMLALEPSLLLLDEPASGISQAETENLGPLLRRIKAATGATILMIEHDMPLVMGLSDHVYCLAAGSVLAEGTPAEVAADEAVIEAYLGTPTEQTKVAEARARAASRPEGADASPGGEVLLACEGMDVSFGKLQVLYGVDFEVRRGERVALLGTNGAGKSTILKAASNLIPHTAGTITWKGRDTASMTAEELVRDGLGHVPGGRGVFPSLSVLENLRLGGYLLEDQSSLDDHVDRVASYFPWLPSRMGQAAGTLSGGEQQQLAVARALILAPEVLMIDEMSLGLAPVIVEQLMEIVQRLWEDGLTVVMVEQQATFALGYTDRAYFMEKGEVRYQGDSAGLLDRSDLLRSVFLAGAAGSFGDDTGSSGERTGSSGELTEVR